jgi:DNA primase
VAAEVLQSHWARRAAGKRPGGAGAGATGAGGGGSGAPWDGAADGDGGWRAEGGDGSQRGSGHRGAWRGRTTSRRNPQTATRLDRAAWLLARHAELWTQLPDATHAMLCAQPAPHGPFFACAERVLHEHGAIALDALLADLAAQPEAEVLAPLLARIRADHALDPEPPADDLATVLGQIEFAELSDQLNLLIQSGDLSEDDQRHVRALYARQAQLKQAGAAT